MNEISLDRMIEKDYQKIEAYKTIRTNLQFCGKDKKALVFTSCTPGEGKSTLSLNVAMALAEAGEKVLYLDADIRKSQLIKRCGIRQKKLKGLSHYLSGRAEYEEVLCTTNIPGLDIILAGPSVFNTTELLGNTVYKDLIKSARETYGYIIIDAAPLASVVDAAILGHESDGAVFIIESHKLSRRFVRSIVDQLEKADCPILGIILNKVDFGSDKYFGKYYGKYYGNQDNM